MRTSQPAPRQLLRHRHDELGVRLAAAEPDRAALADLVAHLDAEERHLHPLAARVVPNGRAVLAVLVEHDRRLRAYCAGPTTVDRDAVLAAFAAHVGLVDQLVVGIDACGEPGAALAMKAVTGTPTGG